MTAKITLGVLTFLAAGLSDSAWAQTASITVTSRTLAIVRLDGRIEGVVRPSRPVKVTVAPGEHHLEVEFFGTSETLDQRSEALAGEKPTANGGRLGSDHIPASQFAPDAEPPDALERQKRDGQIRRLDQDLDNLNRRKAEEDIARGKAEAHLQRECQGARNEPAWMNAIRQLGCEAARQNLQRANSNISRLQVEIESKQRQLRRLEPGAQFQGPRF